MDDTSLDEGVLLRRLSDIEAIKQLKARYFRCMDQKQFDGWKQVFARDAHLEVPEGNASVEGQAAIIAYVSGVLEGVRTVHHGHMPEIEITGPDTATGIWAMFDYVEFPPADGAPRQGLQGYGHYVEEYIREDGEWRIKRLLLTRLRIDPLEGGLPGVHQGRRLGPRVGVTVGFVGLGEMGLPMVERLLGAGHEVTFFARRPEVIDAVGALGGRPAASAADVAHDVDVMIVCVYSDAQVRELALGDNGIARAMRSGSTLVIHTTGSPRTAEDIAAAADERGASVLDAPVSGGPAAIRAGAITLLVGGHPDVVAACSPVLESYGSPIIHLGPLGCGQRTKLVNNLLFGANVRLVAEASRLLEGFGMDPAASLAAITNGSGDSAVLRMAVQIGSVDALLAAAGRFVDKDVAVAEAVATDLGADTGLLGLAARGGG